jgi:hypothetical protein
MDGIDGRVVYSVDTAATHPDAPLFRDVPLPGGGLMRMMNRQVHDRAVAKANQVVRRAMAENSAFVRELVSRMSVDTKSDSQR